MKKNTIVYSAVVALVLVGAIVITFARVRARLAERYDDYAALLIKSDSMRSLGDLMEKNPDLRNVYLVTNNGGVGIVVTLEPPKGTRHIYSGPPAYVFDGKGRFIEWSEDIGDDPGFRRKWPLSEANEITEDGLRDIVEPSPSPKPPARASGLETYD